MRIHTHSIFQFIQLYLIGYCLILTGCQSIHLTTRVHQTIRYVIPEDIEDKRKLVLEEAIKLIGTPYCKGGITPFCSDCSGFVTQVFRSIGVKAPRTAHDQYLAYGSEDIIPEPGDLIFFRYANNERISHVAIYGGNEYIIHASEKKGVIVTTLTYMRKHIVGYGRLPIQEFSSK